MPAPSDRFVALDAFRGMTIAAMILVNTPGSWSHVYSPLRHASWHGCTPTDLVFPFFLFITGTAMWFSFRKHSAGLDKPMVLRILRRAGIIFGLGLLLNAFPFYRDYDNFRYFGVLQRIGICYGLAAFLCLGLRPRRLATVSAVLLLGYWALLTSFGGDRPYDLETNLVRRMDLALFGANHLYRGTGIAFDPEGLLSSLPAVVSVVLGYLTGRAIHQHGRDPILLRRMIAAGVVGVVSGYAWDFVFPINKHLWTSSYVIFTAGWAWLTLATLIWCIDFRSYSRWTIIPNVFGMNSLFSYVLSILWILVYIHLVRLTGSEGQSVNGYQWLYETLFLPLAGPLNGSLLFALGHVVLFWAIAWLLYRRRIFIRI